MLALNKLHALREVHSARYETIHKGIDLVRTLSFQSDRQGLSNNNNNVIWKEFLEYNNCIFVNNI